MFICYFGCGLFVSGLTSAFYTRRMQRSLAGAGIWFGTFQIFSCQIFAWLRAVMHQDKGKVAFCWSFMDPCQFQAGVKMLGKVKYQLAGFFEKASCLQVFLDASLPQEGWKAYVVCLLLSILLFVIHSFPDGWEVDCLWQRNSHRPAPFCHSSPAVTVGWRLVVFSMFSPLRACVDVGC